jgi:hypothetical protein
LIVFIRVMELVAGSRITEYCDTNRLSTRERLELFIKVCHGIQQAHQKGVIHRDLKPSNILVTTNDDVGLPKIIEFGIAKAVQGRLTDHTVYTALHQFIGTPAYMSPEQLVMTNPDVDTRSDIYSLGVLLYELLTGKAPFESKQLLELDWDAMSRTIREQEPVRPSARLTQEFTATASTTRADVEKLISALRGDLDWIVMKCLEKERSRRYGTANGLLEDIQRYLAGEPIHARPPSSLYRLRKLAQRNRVAFAALGSIAGALCLGIVASTLEAVRAQRAHNTSERHFYGAKIYLAQRAWEKHDVARVRELLEETSTYPERRFEWYHWQRKLHLNSGGLWGHNGPVLAVAVAPDGERVVTGSDDGSAKIWNAATGTEVLTLTGHSAGVTAVAISGDGTRIATGSYDQTTRLWDAATGKLLALLRGHTAPVYALGFSPDGARIVTAGADGTLRLWTTREGQLVARMNADSAATAVEFSMDGLTLVSGYENGSVRIWDLRTTQSKMVWTAPHAPVRSVAFSADGQRILTAGEDGVVQIRSTDSSGAPLFLTERGPAVRATVFSPEGNRVATAAVDSTVRVYDGATGKELRLHKRHTGAVNCAAFTPNGRRLVTGSDDRSAMLWKWMGKSHRWSWRAPEVGSRFLRTASEF